MPRSGCCRMPTIPAVSCRRSNTTRRRAWRPTGSRSPATRACRPISWAGRRCFPAQLKSRFTKSYRRIWGAPGGEPDAPRIVQTLHRRQDGDVADAADALDLHRRCRLAGREVNAEQPVAGHQPGFVLALTVRPDVERHHVDLDAELADRVECAVIRRRLLDQPADRDVDVVERGLLGALERV